MKYYSQRRQFEQGFNGAFDDNKSLNSSRYIIEVDTVFC